MSCDIIPPAADGCVREQEFARAKGSEKATEMTRERGFRTDLAALKHDRGLCPRSAICHQICHQICHVPEHQTFGAPADGIFGAQTSVVFGSGKIGDIGDIGDIGCHNPPVAAGVALCVFAFCVHKTEATCKYEHTHIHISTHTFTHTHTYIYTHTHITHIHTHTYTNLHTCTYTHMHPHTHTQTHANRQTNR